MLTERENKRADEFAMAHYARQCRSRWLGRKLGAAKAILHCEQTGIGYGVVVECPNCGEKQSITDYESW